MKNNRHPKKKNFVFKIGQKSFDFVNHAYVMAIINATPDSFYDGGRLKTRQAIEDRIRLCRQEGADILDIGGESTRPGAEPITAAEEFSRILPVYEAARKIAPEIPVSIDTYRADVAEGMLKAGADIINDISGLIFDTRMADVIAKKGAVAILMHIKGKPKTMQKRISYHDPLPEIINGLKDSIKKAESHGISRIIVDPGIGFGKTPGQNFEIIDRLRELTILNKPVLVGLSRKSLIGAALGIPVEARLPATMALDLYALAHGGVSIIRVHDVHEGRQTIILSEKLKAQRK
jgi:dihydropteroate synthase